MLFALCTCCVGPTGDDDTGQDDDDTGQDDDDTVDDDDVIDDDAVDDDDSGDDEPTPACTVEIWNADGAGNLQGPEPVSALLSDAEGRLSTRRVWIQFLAEYRVTTLVRYPESGGPAVGLWSLEFDNAVDWVWDKDQIVASVDQLGETVREFIYDGNRLVEERPSSFYDDCCNGSWREYEYTDNRLSRVREWNGFGGPQWDSQTDFEYDQSGRLIWSVREIAWKPAETNPLSYSYDSEGRLETVSSDWYPDSQFLLTWAGQCDRLGIDLPRFPGASYWYNREGWPVDLYW